MRNTLRSTLLLGVIFALGLSLGYWWGTPRLMSVWPVEGAAAVPAGTTLRLTFSHSMQATTVVERLTIEPNNEGNYTWEGNTLIFTPQHPWPAGAIVQVQLRPGGRATGFLSLPLRQGKTWSFTVGQPRLVYLYPAQGSADIYMLNPMSAESSLLTDGSGRVEDFSVSPGGESIYYSVRDVRGGSQIIRLDLPGGGLDQAQEGAALTGTKPEPVVVQSCLRALCSAPVVSPSGDYLAYERTSLPASDQPNYPQVWLQPLPSEGGSTQSELVLAGSPSHQTRQPTWSPDGLLTYYDTDAAAFVFLDPHGGERARFPNQTGQLGAWHPSGSAFVAPEIFFLDEGFSESLLGLEPLANSHLILFTWRDGKTQDLTPGEDMEDIAPAFSPDGGYLAFARKYLGPTRWTPGRQLWLMQLERGEAQPLTDEPLYNHFEFVWSPSGDQLAYVRFNQSALTEPPEIWMINPFIGQAKQLIVGGYAPQWIP